MNEIINFLRMNFNTLAMMFTVSGGLLGTYLYKTRHYRYGRRVGKRVVGRFSPEINRKLTVNNPQKSMQNRVDEVKEMIFQLGFSDYVKDYQQRVNQIESQISNLKKELADKKTTVIEGYDQRIDVLDGEIKLLVGNLKDKRQELSQLKVTEDKENERLESESRTKNHRNYIFSRFIGDTHEALSSAVKRLEADLLRYISAVIILLLLFADFYITYLIFNDIFKIQFKNNIWAIYVSSGVIALVFLVLIHTALDSLEKSPKLKKYLSKIQLFTMLGVGLILLLIYLLMVSLSWLNNTSEVLDSLLRLLFVPLVVAVALIIRSVQKQYGFSFLFTPIKVALYLLLLAIFNILLVFEAFIYKIRGYLQRERFESKTKLTAAEEIGNIESEITRKDNLKTNLGKQLEVEVFRLEEYCQGLVSKLEEKKDDLSSELAKIRKGCENGVVATLRLPVSEKNFTSRE